MLLPKVIVWVYVLAQAPDPVSVSVASGWAGAGLLGAVLSWLLLVHLPAKDKQLQQLMESKDRQIIALTDTKAGELKDQRGDHLGAQKAMTETFTNAMAQQRIDYTAALQQVLRHCDDEFTTVATDMKAGLESSVKIVAGIFMDGLKDIVSAIRTANSK